MYQSSTVGVLLADPTQAKVQVKFEGKAGGEPGDDTSRNYVSNFSFVLTDTFYFSLIVDTFSTSPNSVNIIGYRIDVDFKVPK